MLWKTKHKSDQQLQEQMNKLIKQIQPKPLNCTNPIMHSVKCKNCIKLERDREKIEQGREEGIEIGFKRLKQQ